MALSTAQLAQVFYSAGFRGQGLEYMVAISGRESGGDPAARRTDNPGGPSAGTGDFGLTQINYSQWPQVQKALGLSNINQLLDPVINAKAAFLLSRNGTNFQPWAAGPGGWSANGDPLYGANISSARSGVQQAYTQGLLGQDYKEGTVADPSQNPATAGGKFDLPSDAKIYKVGTKLYAVFQYNGVTISYGVNPNQVNYNPNLVTTVSSTTWRQLKPVDAGNVEELRDMKVSWGTFGKFWNSVLDTVLGTKNPARQDAGVMGVIAQFAGRPDMSPQELNNLLQATTWYQSHTEDQMAWNSLGDAERTKRTDEMAARMVDTWFQFTGQSVDISDPRIQNYLEKVASGKMGFGAWTQTVVKAAALDIDNSPWNRTLSDEKKNELQPGVDVENSAQRVKELARRWGIQWSEETYQDWGRRLQSAEASDADVIGALQSQAKVLFPWLPDGVDVQTASAPWVNTYQRVMETSGDHMDPKVQQAMSSGTSIWDFEKMLKKSSDWLNTKNAEQDMTSAVAEAGRRMGFV